MSGKATIASNGRPAEVPGSGSDGRPTDVEGICNNVIQGDRN